MDLKSNGMAWVSKLYQKTETFFTEMDDLVAQEPLKYVENQLLAAGKNVKHFCSGLIQDVLEMEEEEKEMPSSPLEVNEKNVVLASGMASLGFDGGHQNGSCNSDSSGNELSRESVEQHQNDLHSEKHNGIGPNMGIEENSNVEKIFSSDIREVTASADETSNNISVHCGGRQTVNEGTYGQAKLQPASSVKSQDVLSISESSKLNSATDAKDDVSSSQPTDYSNISSESHECGDLDVGIVPCDNALSTVSDDSNGGTSVEESRINHFTKEGTSSPAPISKLKLNESCIVVDCNETLSASEYKGEHFCHQKYLSRAFSSILKFAKDQKQKKATFSRDLKRADEPRGRHLNPASASGVSKLMDQELLESEWEII